MKLSFEEFVESRDYCDDLFAVGLCDGEGYVYADGLCCIEKSGAVFLLHHGGRTQHAADIATLERELYRLVQVAEAA
ncbi:hypothetical protein [Phyllobacterium sp. UNC302MFCol5.2]|uniref:hypothetical protein n=1 Tax=Phyllobacterium sp. UNC302MFCol5.2 TaxID=1449065 RepID=UPI000481FF2B|nr:hypothetical protein [Phyllobacterium sp. UNC302MFCol5.2]